MTESDDPYVTRATLLERLHREQDEKTWEEFVYYYRHFIYLICRKMNLSHHDAEEVTQAVLVKIWNKLPEFEYDRNQRFRGWLFQVIRNAVRDHCRKVSRTERLVREAGEHQAWNVDDTTPMPAIEALAEKEWRDYIANMALENIRPHFSQRVIEVFVKLAGGQTAPEIAQELGIPRNTVNVYKKRVSAKLKDEVQRLITELD